jgi:primosomal protein N' (replication factor Y)
MPEPAGASAPSPRFPLQQAMPHTPKTASPVVAPVILRVAVPSPLRRLFDYLPPADLSDASAAGLVPGMRVAVPFGTRTLVAILVSVQTRSSVASGKLKRALHLIDEQALLPPSLMELYVWAAQYYQHPPGEVFQTMLPALLRQDRPAARPPRKVWRLTDAGHALAPDALRRAPRQREIIDFLSEHGELDKTSLLETEISPAALATLVSAGLVLSLEEADGGPPPALSARPPREPSLMLNGEQLHAVGTVAAALDSYSCFLLDGVTGSGKTEVYLQIIATVLSRGQQALVLVPEISLTPQTIGRFRRRFQCRIAVLHSGLTDTERLHAWLDARDGVAQIIIGTRSALFTPMARPGVLIVDEEHDGSFKQQDGFRYSARDLAVVRARRENICIVLGSATPSLESLYNVRGGRYTHLPLTERAGLAAQPSLHLVDTTQEQVQEGFSGPLLSRIGSHLQAGNQVLVFLNRRGFAPTLQCGDCGWISECAHCDARMTLHKTTPHLRCHHCDSRRPIDRHCPLCKSRNLQALGLGTERSQVWLQGLFPDTRVLRIDRDTTRRKNELDVLLNEVHQGGPCILIGTQMLAKGHHFPRVTLVAVLDADAGLFSADFRGQEHTAQLLMQVAGRSGREGMPGEVLIQTRHASHPTLQTLVREGYGHFARVLLEERRLAGMPPYSALALIRAEAEDYRAPESFLALVRTLAEARLRETAESGITLMGPLPAPMEKRAGKFRAQLQISAQQRPLLQQLLAGLCPQIEALREARSVRWSVDVDPQDMI